MSIGATVREEVEAIYRRHSPHFVPYAGAAFLEPSPERLRVMLVGINAYVSPPDWNQIDPSWLSSWFETKKYRYDKGVRRAGSQLARHLITAPSLFAGMRFEDPSSFYSTNAIKVYVSEAEGKRADQLTPEHFERHLGQWHDELEVLSKRGAAPHIIVVFGQPFWTHAWSSFRPGGALDGRIGVRSYRAGEGPALHYANRIRVGADANPHDLLLVRLRHPAARTRKGSASWLLEQPGFQALARKTPES